MEATAFQQVLEQALHPQLIERAYIPSNFSG